jgi:hypothetical protein
MYSIWNQNRFIICPRASHQEVWHLDLNTLILRAIIHRMSVFVPEPMKVAGKGLKRTVTAFITAIYVLKMLLIITVV